jgi:hypothetical protein
VFARALIDHDVNRVSRLAVDQHGVDLAGVPLEGPLQWF